MRFMNMWEKKILASVIEKKIGGNQAFFRDNYVKNQRKIPYMYIVNMYFSIFHFSDVD